VRLGWVGGAAGCEAQLGLARASSGRFDLTEFPLTDYHHSFAASNTGAGGDWECAAPRKYRKRFGREPRPSKHIEFPRE
jgi:hypothetical protein